MMIRYAVSVLVGLTMTLNLLYAMHALIDTGHQVISDPPELKLAKWIAERADETPPLPIEPPKPIPPPVEPPIQLPPDSYDAPGPHVFVKIPEQKPGDAPPPLTMLAYGDGPLVNVVRVQPIYPARAIALGIEGHVTVQFDVSATGSVMNVVILESSHAILEKAAIKAAYRFRFKPRIVDGIPVGNKGIVNRFRFEIDN